DPAAPPAPPAPGALGGGVQVPQPKELPKGAMAKERTMKLTRIDFRGWMFSNTKNAQKHATFREGVEVFNVPAEIFDVPLDIDKLPKDGFFLKCETLELQSRKSGDKTIQAMVAKDQVYFRNPEVFGLCDELHFDET